MVGRVAGVCRGGWVCGCVGMVLWVRWECVDVLVVVVLVLGWLWVLWWGGWSVGSGVYKKRR